MNRIIVALDVDSRAEALNLVNQLRGRVSLFKIGSQLFTSEGPDLVREIVGHGERVFLDLKFHDIPNTVSKAVIAAAALRVSMLTLHTGGGLTMMSAAANALKLLQEYPSRHPANPVRAPHAVDRDCNERPTRSAGEADGIRRAE